MVFRREGTYAIVAVLVALVVAAVLFAVPAWAQDAPDVTITKRADQQSVDVGEELTYTITVTNNQATENPVVSGLQIRDILPDNVDFVDVRERQNVEDCPTTIDEEVRCNLSPLASS
jgi:uncharacterized repeat protein (TIGR01451 family)